MARKIVTIEANGKDVCSYGISYIGKNIKEKLSKSQCIAKIARALYCKASGKDSGMIMLDREYAEYILDLAACDDHLTFKVFE